MLVTSGTHFFNLTKIIMVEGKVVLIHAIKASRGSGSMASVILNLSIRCSWLVSL